MLRDYQQECVEKMKWGLEIGGNSVITLPTGCLAKGTPIPLWNGKYKNVEDIKSGDTLISFNEYSQKYVSNKVDSVFRTCIKPKPMIELIYEEEKITVTYDHPFYNGEGFYPLYQLIWGEMETSQRVQLKLLCKQYGANFNHQKTRGKHSCCNETCSRCKRLFKNSYEWKNGQSSPNNSEKLAVKPIKITSNQSYKQYKKRQQSGKLGMVFSQIQRLGWIKDWKNKNTNTPQKQQVREDGERKNQRILSKKHGDTKQFRKKETLRYSSKTISTGDKTHFVQSSDLKFSIKVSEPYYSICMQKAPYTYCIGKKHHYITHNSGKTYVIAGFVEQTDMPVLILVPSKELLEQDLEKLEEVVDRSEIGVFSASMDEKQVKKYTIGTIQSIYKKPELFDHYSVAIIDECHLYNPKKLSGMYNKFFRAIGNPIVFGLTATPYRQDILYEYPGGWSNYHGHKWQKMQMEAITTTKMITRYKEKFWDRMLYVANTIDLQNEGYLCPLRYFDLTMIDQDQIPLNKSKSDFNLDLYEELLAGREREIVNVLSQLSKQHKSLLVFCATIKQAQRLSSVLKGSRSIRNDVPPLQTPVCDFVSCHTPQKEREQLIKDFREAGGILFNVGILTTGFNYNQLEAIALIRPTRSLNLYNQMIGRVTRVKDTGVGYVYDFSGTVKKLGRIETIQVTKNSGQWDVVSETKKGGFHLKKLYSYRIGS